MHRALDRRDVYTRMELRTNRRQGRSIWRHKWTSISREPGVQADLSSRTEETKAREPWVPRIWAAVLLACPTHKQR